MPTGKRKREIGLARFLAQTNDLVVAEILDKEIEQKKNQIYISHCKISFLRKKIPVVPVTHFVFFFWAVFLFFVISATFNYIFFVISTAVGIITNFHLTCE